MISVLIPCRNYGRFLQECLDSVLAQRVGEPLEILVLDDASIDATAEVCRHYPQIRYIRRDASGGVAAARNQLIREMRGDYAAFLDADDVWVPGIMQAQLDFLILHPESPSVGCGIQSFAGKVPEPPYFVNFSSEILLVSRLIRADVFRKIGYFDEMLKKGEDTDYIVRMCQSGFGMKDNLRDVYYLRRIHDHNLTGSPGNVKRELAAILRKNLRIAAAGKEKAGD